MTNTAKNMIESAIWDTYAVDSLNASSIYLQERGIITQYTGITKCVPDSSYVWDCDNNVNRTSNWIGMVGLMYSSDVQYANGWLYSDTLTPWTISPSVSSSNASNVCYSGKNIKTTLARENKEVFPSVYLKAGIKVVSGNGDTEPYILAVE